MDVVPTGAGWTHDPFGGEINRGRLYGRGSGDMKGALAAMMITLDVLRKQRKRISGGVVFQAVVDEEVGTPIGTGHLVKRGLRADFAIVGEPTSLEVCTCHKGSINYEITTHGKAAHASVPHAGVSAILAMQGVISGLTAYSKRLPSMVKHPLLGSPTINVGIIEGGTKVNIVPDSCRIVGERRVVPPETANSAASQVAAVVKSTTDSKKIKYDMKVFRKIEPSEARDEAGAITALLGSVRQVIKKRRRPIGFVATCDAHYLNNIARIPTVICGPGSLTNIHNADEYVEIKELESAGRIYALTFLKHFQR
jgi:acetylornithine deacetylase/succinyl-diaminopimelate desuccinylase family protein